MVGSHLQLTNVRTAGERLLAVSLPERLYVRLTSSHVALLPGGDIGLGLTSHEGAPVARLYLRFANAEVSRAFVQQLPTPNPDPNPDPDRDPNPDPIPIPNPNPNPNPVPDPDPDPDPDPGPDPDRDPNPDPNPRRRCGACLRARRRGS